MLTAMSLTDDATPTPRDLSATVLALEGRHGNHAAPVADFYAAMHDQQGDAGRSWAWASVAALVRKRERQRASLD